MDFTPLDIKLIELVQKSDMLGPKFNEIAGIVKKPPSTVFRRIKALEEKGVIKKYTAIIDPKKVNRGLTAFLYIKLMYPGRIKGPEDVREHAEYLMNLDEVQELYIPVGSWNFMAKTRTEGIEQQYRFIEEKIMPLPIDDVRSEVIMVPLKEAGSIKPSIRRVDQATE